MYECMIGVVTGCLRKLEKWSLVSIFEEFRRFSNARLVEHEQFIELFDTDLVEVKKTSPQFIRDIYFAALPSIADEQFVHKDATAGL